MQKNNEILVIYVGIAGIRSEDIDTYVNRVTNRIAPVDFNGIIITIPIQSHDSRIECINPKYITNKKLVEKHNELMNTLNENLDIQINQIKFKNDE
jgi:hypothetical protein